MQMQANIDPVFDFKDFELNEETISRYLADLPKLRNFFKTVSLTERPTASLEKAYIDGEYVEGYEFTVTRRYMLGGELHIGGTSGEVMNVDTFVGEFEYRLKEELKKREGE